MWREESGRGDRDGGGQGGGDWVDIPAWPLCSFGESGGIIFRTRERT